MISSRRATINGIQDVIDEYDAFPEELVLILSHKTSRCFIMIQRDSEDGIYEDEHI